MALLKLLSIAGLGLAAAQSSIADTAVNAGLTTLVSVLTSTGLLPMFQNPGTYTVFAPTNAAFAAIPAPLLNFLTNPRMTNNMTLASVLKYHVLGSIVYSSAIAPGGTALNTACGAACTPLLSAFNNSGPPPGAITIRASAETAVLANVTMPNVACTNGVVHVQDAVLVPMVAGLPTQNVVQVATGAGLTTLVQLLTTANLVNTLSMGNGVYTVFAPANAAFTSVPAYISSNVTALTQVLLNHVIVGRYYAENLPLNVRTNVTTLAGQTLGLVRSVSGVMIYSAGAASMPATVTTADVDSTNAVAHVIDKILLPAGLPAQPNSASTAGVGALLGVLALAAAIGVVKP